MRHLRHRNARRRRLQADRPLLFIRPKPSRPTRHAITIVSTILGGHYPAPASRGRAVRPDGYDRVCRTAGCPKTIRVDQGSEFVSRDMDLWAYQRGVVLDFSRPGKPMDNAFIEAFNGRFRAECLNQHWFLTLADAAEKLEAWRRYYNEERPHGAIGNKVPIMLTQSGGVTSPSP